MLGVAGCNYIMGVPGADDVMLHYQSTSFHDALISALGAGPEAGARIRSVAWKATRRCFPRHGC